MSARRIAFPVMDALQLTNTHMSEVTSETLPRVRDMLLQKRLRGFSAPPPLAEGGLQLIARIGEYVALPMTIVGSLAEGTGAISSNDDGGGDELLVHAAGMPGAFPVGLADLVRFRGQLVPAGLASSPVPNEESVQLGGLYLLEAMRRYGLHDGKLLDRFYMRARRGALSCAGSAALFARGDEVSEAGLRLDFPYHCGGAQAEKRFLDTSAPACTHFAAHGAHGTKVLSRYGVAVSVGVAVDAAMQVPCLLWHPTGAQAACLAPVLHGARLVPVGAVKLAYNGPTSACEMLHHEDPRRYMNPVSGAAEEHDGSVWLTEGLFGVRPGDEWTVGADGSSQVVQGVRYDDEEREFELYVRDPATGVVSPAGDV